MNKIKKIIIFLVILLMVFTVNCYATSCSEIESSAKAFKDAGEGELSNINSKQNNNNDPIGTRITSKILPIYKMLTVAGILIIGICILILGIQWVCSRAAPEAQAKLKNRLVALCIAGGVLFGSYSIWSIIVKILDSIDG